MRQAIVSLLLCLGLAAGSARAASLIGEELVIRLDRQGLPYQTVTVGDGPELSGVASPVGNSWIWTVDFGVSDFTITAVVTGSTDLTTFFPGLSFASSTPGLIPGDAGSITLTEQIARNGDTNADIPGIFDLSPNVIVGSLTGYGLAFFNSTLETVPPGSFVRWSGTLALTGAAVPLPAPGLLLLGGLAALGLVRGRRRA